MWNSCPPRTVRLATALLLAYVSYRFIRYKNWSHVPPSSVLQEGYSGFFFSTLIKTTLKHIFAFVSTCVVGNNQNTPNRSFMVDDTLTQSRRFNILPCLFNAEETLKMYIFWKQNFSWSLDIRKIISLVLTVLRILQNEP